MLQEQMVLALEGDETGAGNACSQLATRLERKHRSPRTCMTSVGAHFGQKIGDIEIARDIEISGSALRGGSSSLQLVENSPPARASPPE